jgi:hypothetical protein
VGIAALKRLIIQRTEGNPFFMEEMVQALFEQGVLVRNGVARLAKPLEEIRVPPTVQAILASRIDRLPAAEKELLQTLAILGREFPLGLVKRVAANSHDELGCPTAPAMRGNRRFWLKALGIAKWSMKTMSWPETTQGARGSPSDSQQNFAGLRVRHSKFSSQSRPLPSMVAPGYLLIDR